MKYRACVVILLLLLSLPSVAQFSGFNHGSVSGVILNETSRPARDVRVELRTAGTGQTVASTYTNAGGFYEFAQLASGEYELVAVLGIKEVRQRVEVQNAVEAVNLRLPAENLDAGNNNSVSVAQFQVPKKARSAYKKASKAYDKQKLDEAAEHLAKALEIHPEYAEALTLRGIMTLNNGNAEAASKDFEAAIAADHAYATSYLALGAAYNALNRFDDALRTIDRGVALSPASWQGYFEMGKAFAGKGNYESALRMLQKAQALAPKEYAPIHLVKAHAQLALKNYPEAMVELQMFLDREPAGPNSAQAQDTLARVKAFTTAAK
jgi:tetratricopeptide (TPR) repeat protein